MRSDREEIPAPFTKADADKAETMEAKTRAQRAQRAALTAGCQVYWPSPYEVCGAIKDKYNSLGGPGSFLSFPNSTELTNPDGFGKRTQFLNGPIYWSGSTGAHPVVNSFLNRWGVLGYEGGYLKYPTTDEIVLPDGGRRQEFQGGAIYVAFQNAVGSAIRNGPLRDKYNAVGGLAPGGTLLGYPTQDQANLPDGQGQMDRFQNGVIYWSPATGAWPVVDRVLKAWGDAGYEKSSFGYPVADQVSPDNGVTIQQRFQRGTITAPGPKTVKLSGYMPYITPEEVLQDAQAAATAANRGLADAVESALLETGGSNNYGPRNEDDLRPIPTARRAGDIFYSDAAQNFGQFNYEHGHNGIYVNTTDTVQALDPKRGVQLVLPDSARGLYNPTLMEANTSDSVRSAAAVYASGKVGSGYNKDFAFNRRDWRTGEKGTYNCSQLVWAAYMNASNANLDLDKDGGWGVWPKDIRDSTRVTRY